MEQHSQQPSSSSGQDTELKQGNQQQQASAASQQDPLLAMDPATMQAILMGDALVDADVGGMPFLDFRDSMLNGQLESLHWLMAEGDDSPYA